MQTIDNRNVYSVSEVNYFARKTLEEMVFWVEGEISSFKSNPNWVYCYFSLKDENALLPCMATSFTFKGFDLDSIVGQKVVIYGTLSIYEKKGEYSMKVQIIEPLGEGYLQKKYELLYKKLKAEGLFDAKYKKEIPKYLKKICIVTSAGSDGWNDFKTHTVDKFPIIEFYTADVRMEGPRAVSELLDVLPKVDKFGFDAIVITRGGGAVESLGDVFNDEALVRAIFSLKTPTIVAIGHEANETLAELVADLRASTPTDAANIITAGYREVLVALETLRSELQTRSAYYFSKNFQSLDHYYFRLTQAKVSFKDLPHKLNTLKESLKRHEKYLITDADSRTTEFFKSLTKNSKALLYTQNQNLENLNKSLLLLSPTNTLSRGYSITTDEKGRPVRSVDSVVVGSALEVKLADGSLKTTVKSKYKNG